MKKYILLFVGIITLSFNAKAQDGFENFFLLDDGDSKALLEAYFNPAAKGFIVGMNSGWYHTAKVHKKFGFDITIGGNLSIVPSKDKVFKLGDLALSSSITGNANYNANTEYPTFAGDESSANLHFTKSFTGFGPRDLSFSQPQGITGNLPLNAIPSPAIQLSLGLPFKSEVILRMIPKIGIGDANVDMLGIGFKKEITSWFGPLDKLPFLHVSLLASYTTLNAVYGIDDSSTGTIQSVNGLAKLKTTAFTAQALASLNFPFINIYGGFGYGSGTTNLTVDGDFKHQFSPYEATAVSFTPLPGGLDFKNSSFNSTIGVRLSMGFFKIFASYSMQEYNTLNAGIAISVR